MAKGRAAQLADSLEQAAGRALTAPGALSGAVLLAAVSGGPDSMALLHALRQRAPDLGLRLHVAHLDHGLRGAEAAADAEYVAQTAAVWGLPCTVGRADVQAERAATGGSLEAAARRVRYRFLAQTALAVGAPEVATGHTAGDQAETVLLRLIRGAGTAGLAAMAPVALLPYAPPGSGLRLIRPLLRVGRAEVEAYCAAHGITPRRDASNESAAFLRNRVRHEALPLLATMNPNITAALNRTAALASADNELLDGLAAAQWDALAAIEDGRVRFSVAALQGLPLALRTRLLRRAIVLLRGGMEGADLAGTDAALHLLDINGSRRADLGAGLAAQRQYDALVLTAAGADLCEAPPLETSLTLPVPGEAAAPGWRFTARLVPPDDPAPAGPLTVRLDAAAAGGPLTVRSWRPGDRMQPLGMSGSRKLQDLFTDAKIPAPCRERVPVLEGPQGIVWVVGLRIGHRFRVTPESGRVLLLTADPLGLGSKPRRAAGGRGPHPAVTT